MEINDKGSFFQVQFSRMFLFEQWHLVKGTDIEKALRVLETVLRMVPDAENVEIDILRKRIQYITKKLAEHWKKTNRTRHLLISTHLEWLRVIETIDIAKNVAEPISEKRLSGQDHNTFCIGRPKKNFEDCSKRTQRRRIADLSKIDNSAISTIINTSSTSCEQSDINKCEVNPDEILSLITEAKLTKHQYLLIKEFINNKNSPLLPSYQKVLDAKKQCYPKNLKITEKSAEVELQSLLDHTASRILNSQNTMISNIDPETLGEVVLIGKWGFDGSTGHSEYKQCFSNDLDLEDGSLFVTSYVPLRLVSVVSTTEEETILWKNPRPSSTRYCRPIRFQFAKETKQLSTEEADYFKEKINNLIPTTCMLKGGEELKVHHELQLTMVDGKICNALTDTASASRCYLCKATPKDMNQIDMCLNKEIDTTTLGFGLSPLHSWIRFFEYFVHLSYRLEIRKWQIRSAEEKEKLAVRKRAIQSDFKRKLGLIVDKPRSGGSGNSNDGNTARKFFANSAISASITGIRQDLIDRCGTILNCLNSGFKINADRFKEFALETARQLVEEYPWYNLPASMHKVLIHGSQIIDHMMVSIGELSEEAAESTNKNIKLFRLSNTRKMTRVLTNTDLLNRLLLNSDPLFTGLRKLPRKKISVLSDSVKHLLDF